ncbi:MAG: hypothetical protein KBG15_05565 [Kofleriaceae bacterium]|nr:hypothetical protein [Kofleriaceae bacterium]
MKILVVILALCGLASCNDLRDFRGTWQGGLTSVDPILRDGMADGTIATLDIVALDRHGLRGRLTMPGITLGEIVSVPGAEADALATMTFDNAPLRVYLCFAQMAQGESALVLISLFDDRHIDLRIIRGGSPGSSIYALFGLRPLTADR